MMAESKIESALIERSHKIWSSSLEGVIAVASGKYEPYCSCDPIAHNPRIQEFLIETSIYTPQQLLKAFETKADVSAFLVQMALSHMYNLFKALGDAARSERPLYTKDRREFWSDPAFTVRYEGSVHNALVDFGTYLVAEREDFILLDKNNDYERCANKEYAESTQRFKESSIRSGKKYPNDPKFGIGSYHEVQLQGLNSAQRQLQAILSDDVSVAEDKSVDHEKFGKCRQVGVLVYRGIIPAIDHLIDFYTHKKEISHLHQHI